MFLSDVCVYIFVLFCAHVINTDSTVFQGDHLGTKRYGIIRNYAIV